MTCRRSRQEGVPQKDESPRICILVCIVTATDGDCQPDKVWWMQISRRFQRKKSMMRCLPRCTWANFQPYILIDELFIDAQWPSIDWCTTNEADVLPSIIYLAKEEDEWSGSECDSGKMHFCQFPTIYFDWCTDNEPEEDHAHSSSRCIFPIVWRIYFRSSRSRQVPRLVGVGWGRGTLTRLKTTMLLLSWECFASSQCSSQPCTSLLVLLG